MTADELKEARLALGLTTTQMALMLGFDGAQRHAMVLHMETGRRRIRPAQCRLVAAYLAGYRPPDWPQPRSVGLNPTAAFGRT